MKKNLIILFTLLFATQVMLAQKVKFRKIAKEDLEATVHPTDFEAEAAILYQSCRRHYVFNTADNFFKLQTQVHQRIKIYNQDGVSWADIAIPYHIEGSFSKLRAYTYNLKDGKIEEIKLENQDIFTEDINKYVKRRKAAMPGVAPGSIIDIEYELSEPATISLRPFYMQYSIPVDYSEYIVETPEYFRFNKAMKGIPLKMDINNSSKSGVISQGTSSNNRSIGAVQSHSSNNINYSINVETYIAKDVPALKEEPFVTNMNNYRSSINYELSFIQYQGGRMYNYSTTWDDIADNLMASEYFGQVIDRRLGELNPIVEEAMALDLEERIPFIYYYVRDTYNWNDYYGEQTMEGMRKLLSQKTGNVGDINLLLINLLRKAELDVMPVVLSTRSNGILNISHPSFTQINYVIAQVNVNGKTIYLDATDKDLLAGYLPPRALNIDGITIDSKRKTNRIDIVNPNNGNTTVFAITSLTDDLKIEGQARLMYENFDASMFKKNYKSAERKEGYTKSLMDTYPDLEISEINHEGVEGHAKKVTENMNFELEGMAIETGEFIYLNPMLIWQDTEHQFKREKREFPVFYNSTGNEKYMITIKLPETVEVESLPQAVRLALPENMGNFLYSVTAMGNNITVQYQYSRTADMISPLYYEALRNYMTLLVDKQAEKIVLKKI